MAGRRVLAVDSISISADDPLRDLFEACEHGDVARVRAIVTPANVNARDTAGRKSSPLHFAAGPANRSTRPGDHYRTDTGLGRSLLGFFKEENYFEG